jgi:hypothetical protein
MAYTGTLMQVITSRASITIETPLVEESTSGSGGGGSTTPTEPSNIYVPYTGATADVDLGTNSLNAEVLMIENTWRIIISGVNLHVEKWDGAKWVTKQIISE